MTVFEWLIFSFSPDNSFFRDMETLSVKWRKSWKAIVPIYNAIILLKIIRYPKWWVICCFPVINLLIISIWIGTLRSFGRHSLKDYLLCVATLGFYIYLINYDKTTKYIKIEDDGPKSAAKEWISSITFAVIAATIVHNYIFQPFIIPTGSLEKSLLIGDF